MKKLLSLFTTALIFLSSCSTTPTATKETREQIRFETDFGDIIIELFNETPLHRDNMLKLVDEGAFDSLLFHRVIEKFMIQGGDPDSKNAKPGDTLGNGGLDYTVPAEFQANLFHKRGALGAARDGNPQRASSSMQFFIVQGRVYNDSLLEVAEARINGWLAKHYFTLLPQNKAIKDSLEAAIEAEDEALIQKISDKLTEKSKSFKAFTPYAFPEKHREVYKTIGGAAHLDQNYTVFGEVIQGMDIVDSIAAVETNELDRPINDIRILRISRAEFEEH